MASSFYAALLMICFVAGSYATPLDDYVNMPDTNYRYDVLSEHRVSGEYIAYVINMTSQKWLTYNDSDSAIWWHYLTITIPDNLTYPDKAAVWVTGGSNHDGPPDPLKDQETLLTSLLAVATGSVTAILRQIPNQPIVFKSDPRQKSRSEDAIIAFTWRHFIENGTNEPYWLLRMPMTKAVVRAMDTVTDHVAKVRGVNVQQFVVAGASKRGWTTWTTGAVDKRVVAISPFVLDLLNMVKNLHHMYRSLGGWTFAFEDYYDENITLYLDHPNTQKLADIVDPLAYKDRLTMPKLIVTAGSDEFFLPDDSDYYFNQIPGPKYLRITPNAEHSLTLHHVELLTVLTAFMRTINEPSKWSQPNMAWTRYENSTHGIIEFTSDPIPLKVEVFRTLTNRGKRRDFRLAVAEEHGSSKPYPNIIVYKTFPCRNPSPGKYVAEFLTPQIGWQCFFIRAYYPAPGNTTISFTTEANITPGSKYTTPDCHGESCRGTLV
ncbi:autocrine proliferation repressor protein A-like [Diadema setosum]|uniref:autocrine proliferation repressor protein A-like n=1 Tax=Diadema setosum TaxID=31175 RepID=UPI003B3A5018